MIVLDTNVISALLWGDVSSRLVVEVASRPVIHTTAVNLAEILYGLERRGSAALWARYTEAIFPLLSVLPFDAAAAAEYGKLRACLAGLGTPIEEADLMIASIALAHEAVLVTGNTRHFSRVPGLRLENWLE